MLNLGINTGLLYIRETKIDFIFKDLMT